MAELPVLGLHPQHLTVRTFDPGRAPVSPSLGLWLRAAAGLQGSWGLSGGVGHGCAARTSWLAEPLPGECTRRQRPSWFRWSLPLDRGARELFAMMELRVMQGLYASGDRPRCLVKKHLEREVSLWTRRARWGGRTPRPTSWWRCDNMPSKPRCWGIRAPALLGRHGPGTGLPRPLAERFATWSS